MLATLVVSALLLGQNGPAKAPEVDPAAEVLRLTNIARERAGVPPLKPHEALTKAAQAHAADMARNGYFDHTSRDGSEMDDRVRKVSYRFRALGENIAMGQTSAKQAVESWLKSPGHRKNMLNPEFRDLGVGFARDPKGVIRWVQVFGASF